MGSDAGRGWARGRARGRHGLGAGLPVHRALASVPGQQPLVEEPGERRPLPPRPLGLLQEHEVVVGLAQAGVLLLLPPAEEQLGASPQKAAWKGKARGLVRGPRGRVEKGKGSRGDCQGAACHPAEPSLPAWEKQPDLACAKPWSVRDEMNMMSSSEPGCRSGPAPRAEPVKPGAGRPPSPGPLAPSGPCPQVPFTRQVGVSGKAVPWTPQKDGHVVKTKLKTYDKCGTIGKLNSIYSLGEQDFLWLQIPACTCQAESRETSVT